MRTRHKRLLALTASDLMTRDVVRFPESMPLRDAARLLLKNQIGGAPVVDRQGKCVGVLSAIDFLRLAHKLAEVAHPISGPLPVTCAFQTKHRRADGAEATLCILPPGVCPIQVKQKDSDGEELLVCSQPHCVLADWQVVELETLPTDEVCKFMTPDPVIASPNTPIRTLSRMMVDAHIHRVIIVDEEKRPIGLVSNTDLLAAMAYCEEEPASTVKRT